MRGVYSWQFIRELFPPAPQFIEKDIPDLSSKVFLITGGAVGIGYQTAKLLYSKNGSVYIAGRNESSGNDAIAKLRHDHPESKGRLSFLGLDLGDLTTIKPAVVEFLAKENRLDVLWDNAGVMVPPAGSRTVQGYERQLGVNCIGHFLLTSLLTPLLRQTAAAQAPGAVRVVWVSSSAVHTGPPGGIYWEDINNDFGKATQLNLYSQSKAGAVYLAAEFARRNEGTGIVSVAINPGHLKTELMRHVSSLMQRFLNRFVLYDPIYGAYTEVFAGLSPGVTAEDSGRYIMPWGRFGLVKDDLVAAMKSRVEGGTGGAERFWEFCEEATKPFN
ncbi:hypothetical protein NM208_g590 [Fusarium decemcellulare]|uniref:Uncharacterized protein n=1 Tax=Fusarium decemcellulare TaxID=57161 RepID=A0ACC1SZ95_9HYPO|nr:hypothetical protein NM208_g590 [Fusarium decemcellulare]